MSLCEHCILHLKSLFFPTYDLKLRVTSWNMKWHENVISPLNMLHSDSYSLYTLKRRFGRRPGKSHCVHRSLHAVSDTSGPTSVMRSPHFHSSSSSNSPQHNIIKSRTGTMSGHGGNRCLDLLGTFLNLSRLLRRDWCYLDLQDGYCPGKWEGLNIDFIKKN